MRKPQKSILESLGVKSVTSIWHGEISIGRAIQAAAVAGIIGMSIQHINPDRSTDLIQAQAAPGSLTYHDPDFNRVTALNLSLDTNKGVAGYFQRDTFQLQPDFRETLESEINSLIAQTEVAGSWDLYLAARLTPMFMSDDDFQRQIANATLGYIERHKEFAAGELPQANYYTKAFATEIEADRQIFAMADAMAEALRAGGKTPITRRAAELALSSFADEPDRLLAAFNVAKGVDEGAAGVRNIHPLVQAAIQVETTRLSLTSMSGQMLKITEVATNPAIQALSLSRRLGIPVAVRSYTGSFADYYDQGAVEPSNETLNRRIKSGFDLSEGLATVGRGVILSSVPLDNEATIKLPEVRYAVEEIVEQQRFLDNDGQDFVADFRVSM